MSFITLLLLMLSLAPPEEEERFLRGIFFRGMLPIRSRGGPWLPSPVLLWSELFMAMRYAAEKSPTTSPVIVIS